jgi:hypothetical protein
MLRHGPSEECTFGNHKVGQCRREMSAVGHFSISDRSLIIAAQSPQARTPVRADDHGLSIYSVNDTREQVAQFPSARTRVESQSELQDRHSMRRDHDRLPVGLLAAELGARRTRSALPALQILSWPWRDTNLDARCSLYESHIIQARAQICILLILSSFADSLATPPPPRPVTMNQTQSKPGFTIFARSSSVRSTSSSTSKRYSRTVKIAEPSPPLSEDEESVGSSPAPSRTSSESSLPASWTVSNTSPTRSRPRVAPPPPTWELDFPKLEGIFRLEHTETEPGSPSSSGVWYTLTTALLLAFHKEHLVSELWRYLSRPTTNDDLLAVARRLRETILKASVLVGFPRAINALQALHKTITAMHPHLVPILATDPSLRSNRNLTPEQKHARGLDLFIRIYDKHSPRVIEAMSTCSAGDLTQFAIHSIYGELLAEDSIVGDLETGLLEFVCCLADGCAPQAKGHFFGSGNLGADAACLAKTVRLSAEVARMVGLEKVWDPEDKEWAFLKRAM